MKTGGTKKELPEELIVLNCSDCGGLLQQSVFLQPKVKRLLLPLVAGRIRGRPFCRACLEFEDGCDENYGRTEGQRAGFKHTRS